MLIDDIIVWNNNSKHTFVNDKARVINSSCDFGLTSRFSAMTLAEHQCVLIMDDDILLRDVGVLYEAWRGDTDIIHGLFGRRLTQENKYAADVREGPCPIVLTRCMMLDRGFASAFFAAKESLGLQLDGEPAGNGEDILMSYVARKYNDGALNRCYRGIEYEELPAPHAIHARFKNHWPYRTQLCQLLEHWLKYD